MTVVQQQRSSATGPWRNYVSEYSLSVHQYRFAAWAAATAARSSSLCRFTRDQGLLLIKEFGLADIGPRWSDLPEPRTFNEFHRNLRNSIRTAALVAFPGEDRDISHGVAAKLINVYLKVLLLSAPALENAQPQEVRKANALHPTIDRILLSRLAMENVGGSARFWRAMRDRGWSQFDARDYEDTIDEIRRVTNGALWTIERYWLASDDCRRS